MDGRLAAHAELLRELHALMSQFDAELRAPLPKLTEASIIHEKLFFYAILV